MKKLVLVSAIMILLSFMVESGIGQTQSDYALIRNKIITEPEDIYELNRSVAIQYLGNELFCYPRSGVLAYDRDQYNNLRSVPLFVIDAACNRMVTAEIEQEVVKSWGSFGTNNDQYEWPQSLVAHSLSDKYNTTGYYDIYVADTYNDRISRSRYYAPGDQLSFLSPVSGSGIYSPQDVAIFNGKTFYDRTDDEIWVLNGDNKLINFSYDGNWLRTIDPPQDASPRR